MAPDSAPARPKLKDVAARAGVSSATASMVLNEVGGTRVAEATRLRVRAAASSLGYRPNSLARGLRTQRTHTIGLVSDVIITTPYAGRMVQGAQDVAWDHGYVLMVVSTNGDPVREHEAIAALLARQVDGFIYATMFYRVVTVPESLAGSPLVVLDSEVVGQPVPAFVPDDLEGGATAARALLAAGHRRIAHIGDMLSIAAARLRLAGLHRELAAAGCLDESLILIPPGPGETQQSSWGEAAATDLLTRRPRPTAIFAYNDRSAIGVYRAANRLGLRIPQDLSVVGYDDHELVAAELVPPLTTVALPHYEMGAAAATELVTRIEAGFQGGSPPRHGTDTVLVPCPLVVRDSVATPGLQAAERL